MLEEVIRFGAEDSMIGILTTGEGTTPVKLGCILPNIGLAHRIGPHRLNVKIARTLAVSGISTMRFDLSGVGDSPNSKTSQGLIAQAVADMRDAITYMQRHRGIHHFVVFGICSGAQNGYFLALEDPRIVGLLMYDGFSFPSTRSKVTHNYHQFRSTSWRQIGQKVLNRVGARPAKEAVDIFTAALSDMQPSKDEFKSSLRRLIARGVTVCTFYSGSRRSTDKNRGLLGALRDPSLLDRINYRFDAELDHTATSHASQRRLLSFVNDWAVQVASSM